MNNGQLTAASRILILSTGYNSSGFLGGLNAILNQLLYAEEFGFIPVVYFNPWSNDFPDFNRQELFQHNQWRQYFEATSKYTYQEILNLISSPSHPLTTKNLHFLTGEEMLYLDNGKPESIYSGHYGYYKHYKKNTKEWLSNQRQKAQTLVSKYIRVCSQQNSRIETYLQSLNQKDQLLGVVIDSFEKPRENKELRSSVKPYFVFIDEYIQNNPQCTILLVSENEKHVKKFKKRYTERIEIQNVSATEKNKQFNQMLVLSKCHFLLKDHSKLGEFVLYLNPKLPYKDISDQLRTQSTNRIVEETRLYRKRWVTTVKQEGLSMKVLARLIILVNPVTQICKKSIEKHRFSKYAILRWAVLFIDLLKLLRARTYNPSQLIKYWALHTSNNANAGFYDFESAPQKKYFEIRNAWDTNTGFFAYFMMTVAQLKFAETHRLKPVVNYNEPHNHYFEPGYSKNIWENYFEPVTDLNAEDLGKKKGREVTFLDHKYYDRIGNDSEPPELDISEVKVWFKKHRAIKATLTKKYIRPKAFILEMVDEYYDQNMNGHNVLGVHIRGTDFATDQRGIKYIAQEALTKRLGPKEYFPYVDEYLKSHTNALIFIATDQQQYLDSFMTRYKEKVITSESMRTNGDEPLFRIKGANKYQQGIEVFCDSLLLSRCDYLIKGASNISEAAICFNPSIPVIDVMYLPDLEEIDFVNSPPAVPKELLLMQEELIGLKE